MTRPDPFIPATSAIPPPKRPAASTSTKALIGLLLAGTVGIIIFLFVHLSGSSTPKLGTKAAAAACTKGQDCLPDVDFIDTNGVAYTAKGGLAGKVVVINFWATWCKPCLKEIPDLSKISERYKADVVVLGVLTNDNPDNATLLNFQSDNDMSFPVIRVTPDIMASYDFPSQLPTTFIFDRGGKRIARHVGALSADKLAGILEPLVAAGRAE